MCRRYTPNWKEIPASNRERKSTKTVDHQAYDDGDGRETYISFSSNPFNGFEEKKPFLVCDERKQWEELTMMMMKKKNSEAAEVISVSPPLSVNQSPASSGFDEDDWDELRSIVDFPFDPFFNNPSF